MKYIKDHWLNLHLETQLSIHLQSNCLSLVELSSFQLVCFPFSKLLGVYMVFSYQKKHNSVNPTSIVFSEHLNYNKINFYCLLLGGVIHFLIFSTSYINRAIISDKITSQNYIINLSRSQLVSLSIMLPTT